MLAGDEVDSIEGVASIEWANDGHLLYSVPDALGRPHQARTRLHKNTLNYCKVCINLTKARLQIPPTCSAEERACVHAGRGAGSAEACGIHQAWLRALGRGGGAWLRALGRRGGGQLLLEKHDEERFLEFSRSKDGQIVTINASTKTSSEVRLPLPPRSTCLVRLTRQVCGAKASNGGA